MIYSDYGQVRKKKRNRVDCRRSEKRSKTCKRLTEHVLIRRNKTECQFSRESSFSDQNVTKTKRKKETETLSAAGWVFPAIWHVPTRLKSESVELQVKSEPVDLQ